MTQSELLKLFEYHDGALFWKKSPNNRVDMSKEAGTLRPDGYRQVRINGKKQFAHRIIFLMLNGYLPDEIDHIDGNPMNNDIDNLREATRSQNQCNSKKPCTNTSGVKGVYWHKTNQKWLARLRVDGKQKAIGYFNTIEEAALALDKARNEHHKEFANNGQRVWRDLTDDEIVDSYVIGQGDLITGIRAVIAKFKEKQL